MKWRKLGRLYCPALKHLKLVSHAANPLPVWMHGDVYRVFFSGRDRQNRSSVGFADIDILKRSVVSVCDRPVFEHGPGGSFYAHGVSIGNCYETEKGRYILFMGWQCPPGGHWRGEIGRLVLDADFTLRLEQEEPFLSLDETDPLSLSYPWVSRSEGGQYHMWYGSTVTWDAGNGEMLHPIKHANSTNGDHWRRTGRAVPYVLNQAQAFSRPTVVGNLKDGFHMWFSFRSGSGEAYRIGCAISENGETWALHPQGCGIETSATGWDAEMVAYPFVFDHKGQRFMLYNGNGYGKSGFGLAVLVA